MVHFSLPSCMHRTSSLLLFLAALCLLTSVTDALFNSTSPLPSVPDTQQRYMIFGFGNNTKCQVAAAEFVVYPSYTRFVKCNPAAGMYFLDQAKNIAYTTAGESHVFFVAHDNTFVAQGDNEFGQKGNGTASAGPSMYTTSYNLVALQPLIPNIKRLFACGKNSFALMNDGSLYGWGANERCSLGLGSTGPKITPQQVPLPQSISRFFCGPRHSFALSDDGKVFGFGENEFYQLGIGENTQDQCNPVEVQGLNGNTITKIDAGLESTFVQVNDYLLCSGANRFCECGFGHNSPVKHFRRVPILNVLTATKTAHASFVKTKWNEWIVFGSNQKGELGIGHSAGPGKYQQYPMVNEYLGGALVHQGYSRAHRMMANATGQYFWGTGDASWIAGRQRQGYFSEPIKFLLFDDSYSTDFSFKILEAAIVTYGEETSYAHSTFTADPDMKPASCMNGEYDVFKGSCTCKPGYSGGRCEIFDCEGANNCSMNGKCVGANMCKCAYGFIGSNCSTPFHANLHIWGRSLLSCNDSSVLCTDSSIPNTLQDDLNVQNDVMTVSLGGTHLITKTRTNNFLAIGTNKWGELGLGMTSSDINRLLPAGELYPLDIKQIITVASTTVILTTNGDMYCLGRNNAGMCGSTAPYFASLTRVPLGNITSMACSSRNCYAVVGNATLYGMGANEHNQVDSSASVNLTTPVDMQWKKHYGSIAKIAAGEGFLIVLAQSGQLFGQGYNANYNFGLGHNLKMSSLLPLLLGGMQDVVVSFKSVAAKTIRGNWIMLGDNTQYQLGLGHNNAVPFGEMAPFSNGKITFGSSFILFRNQSGLFASGANSKGQMLGASSASKLSLISSKIYADISVSEENVAGVTIQEASYCENGYLDADLNCVCNANWYGSMCTLFNCTTPCVNGTCKGPNFCECNRGFKGADCSIQVIDEYVYGWGSVPSISSKLTEPTLLFPLQIPEVTIASAGTEHAVFLTADGDVYAVGSSTKGQLGVGGNVYFQKPTLLTFFKFLGSTVKYITTGSFSSYVLLNDGSLYCSGFNDLGQCGTGTTQVVTTPYKINIPKVQDLNCNADHCVAITEAGDVYVWGSNSHGQLSIGSQAAFVTSPTKITYPFGEAISKVATGPKQTLFITQSGGFVFAAGSNENYELAFQERRSFSIPRRILYLTNVTHIPNFFRSVFANTVYGSWYCWGSNANAELGLGHNEAVMKPLLSNLKEGAIFTGEGQTVFISPTGIVSSFGTSTTYLNSSNAEMTPISRLAAVNLTSVSFTSTSALAVTGLYCNGKGTYNRVSQRCQCSTGYLGARCELFTCSQPCVNGRCGVVNRGCECFEGYSGADCSISTLPTFGIASLFNATYYQSNRNNWSLADEDIFHQKKFTRMELIDQEWGSAQPHHSMSHNFFAVRWNGVIVPPHSDNYTITLRASDGARLIVDGHILIDLWNVTSRQVLEFESSVSLALNSSHSYNLTVEYFTKETTYSVAALYWASSQFEATVIGHNPAQYRENVQLARVQDFFWNTLPSYTGSPALAAQSMAQVCGLSMFTCESVGGQYGYRLIREINVASMNLTYSVLRHFYSPIFDGVRIVDMKNNDIWQLKYPLRYTFRVAELTSATLSNNPNLLQSVQTLDGAPFPKLQHLDISTTSVCGIVPKDVFDTPARYNIDNTKLYCLTDLKPIGCHNLTVSSFDPKAAARFFERQPLSFVLTGDCIEDFTLPYVAFTIKYLNGTLLKFDNRVLDNAKVGEVKVEIVEDELYGNDWINVGLNWVYNSSFYQNIIYTPYQYLTSVTNTKIYPFVANHSSNGTVMVYSNWDMNIFKFSSIYCEYSNNQTNAIAGVNMNAVICPLLTGEELNQEIVVSLIHKPRKYPNHPFELLAADNRTVQVIDLVLDHPYGSQVGVQDIIISRTSTGNAPVFRYPDVNSTFSLMFDSSDEFPCTVGESGSIVRCTKPVLTPQPDVDIRVSNVYLGVDHQAYFTSTKFAFFKQSRYSKLSPRAFERVTKNITITFADSVFRTDNSPVHYRCIENTTQRTFDAIVQNANTITCLDISPSTGAGTEHLVLDVQANITSIQPNFWVTISLTPISFYFVSPVEMDYLSSPHGGYVDNTYTLSLVAAVPRDIKDVLFCKVDDAFIKAELYNGTVQNDAFTCVVNSSISGSVSISLYMLHEDGEYQPLHLSQNTLPFTFIRKAQILDVFPWAAVVPSGSLTLSSTFTSGVNYGDAQFKCKFDGQLFNAILHPDQSFRCTITANTAASANVSVVMVIRQEEIAVSSNELPFVLMNKVAMRSINPFITYFDAQQQQAKTVTITLMDHHIINSTRSLFCKFKTIEEHGGAYSYSPATVLSNKNQVTCSVSKSNMLAYIDNLQVVLHVRANESEPISAFNFDLSSNDVRFIFIREKVSFELPSDILQKEDFYTVIPSTFTVPFIPQLQYSISYAPYLVTNPTLVIPEKQLSCNFTMGTKTACLFERIQFQYVPTFLKLTMHVTDTLSGVVTQLPLVEVVYNEKVNITSEFPYIGRARYHGTQLMNFKMTATSLINPDFVNYLKCQSTGVGFVYNAIVTNAQQNSLECVIKSNTVEETITVALQLSYKNAIVAVSDNAGSIDFANLRLVPQALSVTESRALSMQKDNTNQLVIPSKYRINQHTLVDSVNQGISFGCTVGVSGNLTCSYGGVQSSMLTTAISTRMFNLFANGTRLVQLEYSTLLYKQNMPVRIAPLAALRGSSQNVWIIFGESTLDSEVSGTTLSFGCETPSRVYPAAVVDRFTLSCLAVSEVASTLPLSALFNASNLATNLRISQASLPFYYVDQGKFSVLSSRAVFFTETVYTVPVDLHTYLPADVRQKVFCSVGKEIQQGNVLVSSTGASHVYNCSLYTEVAGQTNLTVWFDDLNGQFQLSNNSARVLFVDYVYLDYVSPLLAIKNRTVEITLDTQFQTKIDYGTGVTFTCKYGTIENTEQFSSPAATTEVDGQFKCSVHSEVANTLYISLWITVGDEVLDLTKEKGVFYFVDTYFLTPSYAAGPGVSVVVNGYEGVPIIAFKGDVNFQFTDCTFDNGIATCLTPAFPPQFPTFSSHQLVSMDLGGENKDLAINFTIIEYRSLAGIHPLVTSVENRNLNLTVGVNASLTLFEGSLEIGLNPVRDRYQIPITENFTSTDITITNPKKQGSYHLKLYYKSSQLFEPRNSVAITNPVTYTVLDKLPIRYFTSLNTFYAGVLGTTYEITIQADTPIPSRLLPFIACKQGNSYIPTIPPSQPADIANNLFRCTVYSEDSPGVHYVSLFYRNADALNGEIQISNNQLEFVFIQKAKPVSIVPFAALLPSSSISFATDFAKVQYGSAIQYFCSFGTNMRSLATLNTEASTFVCVVSAVDIGDLNVNIVAQIRATELVITTSPLVFSFVGQVGLQSVYPFMDYFTPVGPRNLELELQNNDKINVTRGLNCRFSVGEQLIAQSLFSVATVTVSESTTTVHCALDKQTMFNDVDIVKVTLFMLVGESIDSAANFDLSVNYVNFVFLKNQISIDAQYGILVEKSDLERSFVLSAYIPALLNLDFSLKYQPVIRNSRRSANNEWSVRTADCRFVRGQHEHYCFFNDLNDVDIFPISIMMTVMVYDSLSNRTLGIPGKDIVLNDRFTMKNVYPHFKQYAKARYVPLQVFMSLSGWKFNFADFAIYCRVSSTTNPSFTYYEVTPYDADTISCNVKSFNIPETVQVQLVSAVGSFNFYVSSVNSSIPLQFVSNLDSAPVFTPKYITGQNISTVIPAPPSTGIYNVDLRLIDRGRPTHMLHDLTIVPAANNTLSISGIVPNLAELILPNNPFMLHVGVFVNGKLADTTYNPVTVYETPRVYSVLPSRFIFVDSARYTLQFIGERFFVSQNISVFYAPRTGSGVGVRCQFMGTTRIDCPTPLFTYRISDEPITVDLTMDGINYFRIDVVLMIYKQPAVYLDTAISFYSSNSLSSISGSFPNSTDILVKVQVNNDFFSEAVRGTLFSATRIVFTQPAIWMEDLTLPASLTAVVSFNNGQYWHPLNIFELVGGEPSIYPGFAFAKYPFSVTVSNMNDIVGQALQNNASSLVLCSPTRTVCYPLQNCTYSNSQTAQCAVPAVPRYSDLYLTLKTGDKYRTLIATYFKIYSQPECYSVAYPRKVHAHSTNYPVIPAKPMPPSSVEVHFQASHSLLYGETLQNGIQVRQSEIAGFYSILGIQQPGGKDYMPCIANFTVIENLAFDIDNVEQSEYLDPVLLATRPTMLKITFSKQHFVANELDNMIFRIRHSLFTYTVTKPEVTVISPTEIYYLIPSLNQMTNISFVYPLSLRFGISVTEQREWTEATIKALESLEILPSISSTNPQAIPRLSSDPTVISVRGFNFADKVSCIFARTNASDALLEVEAVVQSEIQLTCTVANLTTSLDDLQLYLKNVADNVYSKVPHVIQVFNNLNVTSFTPAVAKTQGGTPVTIKGHFPSALSVRCKYGERVCENDCTVINPTEVRCITEANPEGTVTLFLSYNKHNWVPASQVELSKFQFLGCEPGYTTAVYTQNCTICPRGTFKSLVGNQPCAPCPTGSFSTEEGSLSCRECPAYTVTNGSAAVYYEDCLCQQEFYQNPNIKSVYAPVYNQREKCISCPKGALCESLNMTVPLAAPGYFNFGYDQTIFYQCFPAKSCPGYAPDRCAEGYKGPRCGVCENGFYRWRNECQRCSPHSWLGLIALVIIFIILVGALFLFSSIRIGHISSLSITFFFWQVSSLFTKFDISWPSAVSTGLSAAAITNFDFSFLSIDCTIRLSYIVKWTLSMAAPVAFLIGFIVVFILGLLRSCFAATVGSKIKLIKPKAFEQLIPPPKHRKAPKVPLRKRIIKLLLVVPKLIQKYIYFAWNVVYWTFSVPSTQQQIKSLRNKCINSYFTFVSFSYIYIMSSSSDLFVCTTQPKNQRTLNQSPDLLCYEGLDWWLMFPVAIFYYITYGLVPIIFFIYVGFRFDILSKNKNFVEAFKFLFLKFKKRRYYWDFVVTIRKLLLSILVAALPPMLVIVFGILIIFISLVLHIQFVPYKKKFHNLMEWIVLMSSLILLFLGLLLYVEAFEGIPLVKEILIVLNVTVIVVASAIVLIMAVWDINTRKSKETHIKKLRKHTTIDSAAPVKDEYKAYLPFLEKNPLDDDMEEENTLDDDEDNMSMNDIIANLFSIRRFRRRGASIAQKGKTIASTVQHKLRKSFVKKNQAVGAPAAATDVSFNEASPQGTSVELSPMSPPSIQTTFPDPIPVVRHSPPRQEVRPPTMSLEEDGEQQPSEEGTMKMEKLVIPPLQFQTQPPSPKRKTSSASPAKVLARQIGRRLSKATPPSSPLKGLTKRDLSSHFSSSGSSSPKSSPRTPNRIVTEDEFEEAESAMPMTGTALQEEEEQHPEPQQPHQDE